MMEKLDFGERLNFSDIDLTAPNVVVEEVGKELEEATRGIVHAFVSTYEGSITNSMNPFATVSAALGSMYMDRSIQEELGRRGDEVFRYECYISTPSYESFKYRLFFMEHGIAHYPVKVVLEQGVANELSKGKSDNYVYTVMDRASLESFVRNIFVSKNVVGVLQELIRIDQVQKQKLINKKQVPVLIECSEETDS